MGFNNLTGLYALLALIPFILMYLIRPKNFEKVIPSLMFILQEKNKFIKASFLQKLLRNLLLLIQLSIIVFLAFSVASPYLQIPHTVMVRNNVIVLDVSASMQTKDGMGTRFSNAITEAKNNLGMRNTLILAENTPVIILEDASSGETLDLLNKITPKATSTDLGDALLLAGDILGNKKGVVSVISDFLPTEGSDLLIAKRSLTAKGNTVNFIDVHNEAENAGITDVIVDKDETIVEIKNYIDREIKVGVELIKDNSKSSEKELTLLPNSKEKIIFKTLPGVSRIELKVNDDMQIDNVAYISAPEKKETNILLITNNPDGSKIKSAMSALGVNLEVREPPTVNAYNVNHDIVIVDDVSKELFVPTDFVDLKKYVEQGGILIIAAQENLAELNTLDLLPLIIDSKEDKTTSVCADVIGMIFPKDPFSDEPCFTSTNKYIKGTAKNDSLTLASAQLDSSPLIIDMKKGLGEVVYYGIIDKESGFYSDIFYPIFWNNIVNYLMKTENIMDYNYKGGKVVVISEQEVKTPSSRLKTNKVLLDELGIYEFDGKKIAVNLVNEKESDVGRENVELKSDLNNFSAEKVKDVDNFDLEVPLLMITVLLLFFEFIYIKRRGDL
ncbi:MAG: BatA and WFA domain-containing protein [Nanoarchaeota archaeon]|nr:BatA and WFA domain-containing protein [Nanoarchaeota archaeon]MBU1946811.1 BatA and WFA domain-containing protein [Nanoarchaeota archaeon]